MAKESILPSIAEQIANRTDVAIAGRYFIDATERCPVSVIGQGVCVALFCQNDGKIPLVLGKALVDDEKKLQGLSFAANSRHKALGIITAAPITVTSIRPFVEATFRYAAKAIYLDREELEIAAGDMYRFFNSPDIPNDQRIYASRDYNDAIEAMLFRKAQRLAAAGT